MEGFRLMAERQMESMSALRISLFSCKKLPEEDEWTENGWIGGKEEVEAQERHKGGTFGQQSIRNLRNRLLLHHRGGEQEKEENITKKKFMYLCTSPEEDGGPINWLMVNVNESSSTSSSSSSSVKQKEPPFPIQLEARPIQLELEELSDLDFFGCTVWNSCKIIIAGGVGKDGPSDKVFIYDIVSKTWDPPSQMNLQRPQKPILVAAGNKLFVFGGHPQYDYEHPNKYLFDCTLDDMGDFNMENYFPMVDYSSMEEDFLGLAINKKHWAEYCCIDDDGTISCPWNYLPPSHRFPGGYEGFPEIRTHAVYPKKSLILFWMDSFGCAYSFDYNKGNWEKFEWYRAINHFSHWSDTVVVIEDFLFWHHHGTIYAHDLLEDLTFPMHTLSRTDLFGPIYGCHTILPTLLVHVDEGKLCLFCCVGKDNVWYCTFFVQISVFRGPPSLKIVPGESGLLNAPVPIGDIKHALECST